MKKLVLFTAATLLSAAAMAHTKPVTPTKLATDSVYNGSFESNYVWTGTVGFGNAAKTWTSNGAVAIIDGLAKASDGKSYASLTSSTGKEFDWSTFSVKTVTSAASIAQQFTASSAGAYNFTFDLAGGSSWWSGQTFQVLVDGNTIGTYALTDSWTAQLASTVLTAGDHTLKFVETASALFFGTSTAFLDNVAITAVPAVSAVPEADTYAMLLAGLGLVGFLARRRNKAA